MAAGIFMRAIALQFDYFIVLKAGMGKRFNL